MKSVHPISSCWFVSSLQAFQPKFCTLLSFPSCGTYPANLVLFDFIMIIGYSEVHRVWSSSLFNLLPPPLTSCMLMPWNQEEISERSNFEIALRSNPGEGDFSSSESKHDGTVPKPKLFVSRRRLQDRGHNPENLSWVRVPVKMVYLAR
jgi:hypothetical protein